MTAKKELANIEQAPAFVANQENVELLKKTLAGAGTNLTDAELQLTIYTATQRGLNPLTKQLYPMKDWKGRLTFITSIDGYRLIAERTKKYRGQTPVQWCGPDGKWVDVWLSNTNPAAAKVGVYKDGFVEPLVAIARWASYVQTNKNGEPTGQWAKGGDNQLAKCAEALALRKAFPEDLSGVYTSDEMDQAQVHAEPAYPQPAANYVGGLKRMPADENEPMPYVDELPGAETQSAIDEAFTKNPITDAQKRKIYAVLNSKGIKHSDQKAVVLGLAKSHLGMEIISGNDLSKEDAMSLIDHLEQQDPEALKLFFGSEE